MLDVGAGDGYEKKVAERSKYQKDEGYGMYYNDVADWNIGDRVPSGRHQGGR